MQEVITLMVFSVFSILFLKEQLKWNYIAAFILVVGAVGLVFLPTKADSHKGVADAEPAITLVASSSQPK